MKDIYIVKRILNDENLSDAAFVIWAALQPYSGVKNDLLLTTDYITYLIYNRVPTRAEHTVVQTGLNELIENGIIIVRQMLGKSQLICDITGLYFENGSEYFVKVDSDEMHKIMNLDTRADKCKMFRYFVSVIGCFNHSKGLDEKYRGKICGVSMDSFNPLITKKNMIRYNEILEENQILYIFRFDDVITGKDNEIKRIPNTYSRYKDKQICMDYAIQYQSIYGHNTSKKIRQSDIEEANKKRGLAQMYKAFCKGKIYDEETVKEIYDYCKEWNLTQERVYKDSITKGYKPAKPEYKDLSVFDDYGWSA